MAVEWRTVTLARLAGAHAGPDGFFAVVIERIAVGQMRAGNTPRVVHRQSAQPQHAVMVGDPLFERADLRDQPIAG